MENTITKKRIFSVLSFVVAVFLLAALVSVSSEKDKDKDKDIQIKSYATFRQYADQGKSFDYVFDVTKEPSEKILDGVLKYSATLDNLLIKDDSIVSIAKKIDDKGRVKIITRTFLPNGDVKFDVKVYKNNEVVQHLHRKGKLNRSVFLETAKSKIKV